jgi:uncharacterized protein (TIGR02996 family)
MASPDEATLLAEIRAAPDDDAPRLAFAGVLSGRGDPWGELIVAGCELARLARERTIAPQRRRTLEDRCRAIRHQRWRDRSMSFDASLERGFCTWLGVTDDQVAQIEGYEFALLRELELWGCGHAGLAALAAWPSLGQLERLSLRGTWRPRGYVPMEPALPDHEVRPRTLERLAQRARPSSLELKEIDLHPTELAGLVRSPLRASLRRLAIIRSTWLRDSVDLDWPALDALELIDLGLVGGDVRRALQHPALDSLTALDLSNNTISDVGMRAITERALPNLRTLRIEQTYLGRDGMTGLVRSSLVRCLTSLSIGETHADPTVGALCLLAEAAEQLIELAIDLRSLMSDSAAEIVGRLRAPLRRLRLRIGDRGFAMVHALLNNPVLRDLRKLDLSNQPLGHAAVVALAHAELGSLEWLDLSNCQLDPESAQVLAQSTTLPHRLSLRLQGNARGPDSVTEPLLERFHDVRF